MNDEIRFQLAPSLIENMTVSTAAKFSELDSATDWHSIELNFTTDEMSILVDYRHEQTKLFQLNIQLGDRVIIGSGKGSQGKFEIKIF